MPDILPTDEFSAQRKHMIEHQLKARGIDDKRVLDAMIAVPREAFLPPETRYRAYDDNAQSIGEGQTISQPYIVAWMTQLLGARPQHCVLEVGTGCGYQTAVLCKLVDHVFTIERIAALADEAKKRLHSLGITNFTLHVGDGSRGWARHAPYDRILCAAAPAGVPPELVEQLAPDGRLVLPVGPRGLQQMTVVTKSDSGEVAYDKRGAVAFVPLIGGE